MRPHSFQIWLPVIALAWSLPVLAAEWLAEPRITLKSGYNDNVRLAVGDHDTVWEAQLLPSIRMGVAEENQGIFATAGLAIKRFTGGSGLDSSSALDRESYFLNTNAHHNTTRDSFKADLNVTRSSTYNAELDTTGNVVSNPATRTGLTIAPSWSRILNERNRLNLGYTYTTIDFSDEPDPSDLIEYDYNVISSSLVHQFAPRLRGTLAVSYSTYKPETGFDSNTLNMQGGITRNFSETLVASFLAGKRETTSDTLVSTGYCILADPGATFPACTGGIPVFTGQETGETDTSGSVFNASITKLLETGSLSASLSRSTNPSSNGELLDTTRLILNGEYRFTERLRSRVTVEYNERETIVNRTGNDANQGDRTLFRIRPRVSWKWRQEWELAGEYEYAENEDESSRTATRNAFYMSLSYQPTKISISR